MVVIAPSLVTMCAERDHDVSRMLANAALPNGLVFKAFEAVSLACVTGSRTARSCDTQQAVAELRTAPRQPVSIIG